ncbi:kinesin-like protein KIN-4A isoform X2 [Dioscorea cayenensis subsp. rotundata]|uniref:Kinesin-like protein KIN-4A isoform X2 n=1 Tax=Dioscorea cayennensis subsp. rotundata TaxID=55577 RepID=A0AB40B669_DIOCR|nr:kinesin-like protein KIN-4A isoform X2 [Dioscorea cayenensis subsp. rotundata]
MKHNHHHFEEELKRSLQSSDSFEYQMADNLEVDNSKEIDEEVAKEWEHMMLQNTMGKELNELNKRLEEKESEMKSFGGFETLALKQHFGKNLMELKMKKELYRLMIIFSSSAHLFKILLLPFYFFGSSLMLENIKHFSKRTCLVILMGQTHKLPDAHLQKLKSLEAQGKFCRTSAIWNLNVILYPSCSFMCMNSVLQILDLNKKTRKSSAAFEPKAERVTKLQRNFKIKYNLFPYGHVDLVYRSFYQTV